MKNIEATVEKLIAKAGTAYLAYVDAEGFPVAKAMLEPREREGLRTFMFSTNTSSNKVACFKNNPKASLYFVDRRFFRGVSLVGRIEVLEDAESKKRIWRDGDTMFYSGGVTDPDYCVLRFTAERGRYYSNLRSEDFYI